MRFSEVAQPRPSTESHINAINTGSRRWNFTEGVDEGVRRITELKSWLRVSWTQHSSVAKVFSVRAKHPCWPTDVSFSTMIVAILKGHRGRRKASTGGSGFRWDFDAIWGRTRGDSNRTYSSNSNNSMANSRSRRMRESYRRGVTRVTRGTNSCTRWKVTLVNERREKNVRPKVINFQGFGLLYYSVLRSTAGLFVPGYTSSLWTAKCFLQNSWIILGEPVGR